MRAPAFLLLHVRLFCQHADGRLWRSRLVGNPASSASRQKRAMAPGAHADM